MEKYSQKNAKRLIVGILILMMLAIVFVLISSTVSAQQGYFQGAESTNSNFTLQYTIGQTFYANTSSNTIVESQGIQQSVTVPDTTPVSAEDFEYGELKVYPNPFTEYIRIESPELLQYEMYNILGVLIKQGDSDKDINTKDMVPAPYFLRVRQDDITVKTLKVIKR